MDNYGTALLALSIHTKQECITASCPFRISTERKRWVFHLFSVPLMMLVRVVYRNKIASTHQLPRFVNHVFHS